MSKQKITIALMGTDPEQKAKAKLIKFATDRKYVVPVTTVHNSHYVLQNFPFNNYLIDVIKVPTSEEKYQAKYDAGILVCASEMDPDEKQRRFAEKKDPYYWLAEKMGFEKRDCLRRWYSDDSAKSEDVEAILESVVAQALRARQALRKEPESKELQQSLPKSKPLSWYQKSRDLLMFMLILLISSVGGVITFSFMGLLFTPFIAAPIGLAVFAALIGIKIAYDNRQGTPVIKTQNNHQNKIETPNKIENRQKPSLDLRSLSPGQAKQAAEKLEQVLKPNIPEGRIFFITFFIDDHGQFFLDFSELKSRYSEKNFKKFIEEPLKQYFKNDFQQDRILITKVLDYQFKKDEQKENLLSATTATSTRTPALTTEKPKYCLEIKVAIPLANSKAISVEFNTFKELQEKIFQALKIPAEKQEIIVMKEEGGNAKLTEKNFEWLIKKKGITVSLCLAPPKKTSVYWSDANPSSLDDRTKVTVFKNFKKAISYLKKDSPLYAIEVDEDYSLQKTLDENDSYIILTSEGKINAPYPWFLKSLGTLKLTSEGKMEFKRNVGATHIYRDDINLNFIKKQIAEISLKSVEGFSFFEEKEGKYVIHSSLSGYFLNLFHLCIPFIGKLEISELKAFMEDLSSLSVNDLLAKYTQSNSINVLVSTYYTINPEVDAPSPDDYRAAFRHLIQEYYDLRQANRKIEYSAKEGTVSSPPLLFVRYFNDENEEVIDQKLASGKQGFDMKSGAHFYETKGIAPLRQQEDAMVFKRLSPEAAQFYKSLSVEEKKALMVKVCQKVEEKHGKPKTEEEIPEGSCAVFGVISGKEIITAGLGDSVIFRVIRNADKSIKEIKLLTDELHNKKYLSDEEIERIKKKSPNFERGKRIGVFSISRSFGDAFAEEDGLSHDPVIKEILKDSYDIPEGGDAFFLFGCDGLYEGWENSIDGLDYTNYVKKFTSHLTAVLEKEAIKYASYYELPFLLGQDAIVEYFSSDNVSLVVEPILSSSQDVYFVGILDGHTGKKVALEISEHVVEIFEEELLKLNVRAQSQWS